MKYKRRKARIEAPRAEVVIEVVVKEVTFKTNDYFIPQSCFHIFEEKDFEFNVETDVLEELLPEKPLHFIGRIEFESTLFQEKNGNYKNKTARLVIRQYTELSNPDEVLYKDIGYAALDILDVISREQPPNVKFLKDLDILDMDGTASLSGRMKVFYRYHRGPDRLPLLNKVMKPIVCKVKKVFKPVISIAKKALNSVDDDQAKVTETEKESPQSNTTHNGFSKLLTSALKKLASSTSSDLRRSHIRSTDTCTTRTSITSLDSVSTRSTDQHSANISSSPSSSTLSIAQGIQYAARRIDSRVSMHSAIEMRTPIQFRNNSTPIPFPSSSSPSSSSTPSSSSSSPSSPPHSMSVPAFKVDNTIMTTTHDSNAPERQFAYQRMLTYCTQSIESNLLSLFVYPTSINSILDSNSIDTFSDESLIENLLREQQQDTPNLSRRTTPQSLLSSNSHDSLDASSTDSFFDTKLQPIRQLRSVGLSSAALRPLESTSWDSGNKSTTSNFYLLGSGSFSVDSVDLQVKVKARKRRGSGNGNGDTPHTHPSTHTSTAQDASTDDASYESNTSPPKHLTRRSIREAIFGDVKSKINSQDLGRGRNHSMLSDNSTSFTSPRGYYIDVDSPRKDHKETIPVCTVGAVDAVGAVDPVDPVDAGKAHDDDGVDERDERDRVEDERSIAFMYDDLKRRVKGRQTEEQTDIILDAVLSTFSGSDDDGVDDVGILGKISTTLSPVSYERFTSIYMRSSSGDSEEDSKERETVTTRLSGTSSSAHPTVGLQRDLSNNEQPVEEDSSDDILQLLNAFSSSFDLDTGDTGNTGIKDRQRTCSGVSELSIDREWRTHDKGVERKEGDKGDSVTIGDTIGTSRGSIDDTDIVATESSFPSTHSSHLSPSYPTRPQTPTPLTISPFTHSPDSNEGEKENEPSIDELEEFGNSASYGIRGIEGVRGIGGIGSIGSIGGIGGIGGIEGVRGIGGSARDHIQKAIPAVPAIPAMPTYERFTSIHLRASRSSSGENEEEYSKERVVYPSMVRSNSHTYGGCIGERGGRVTLGKHQGKSIRTRLRRDDPTAIKPASYVPSSSKKNPNHSLPSSRNSTANTLDNPRNTITNYGTYGTIPFIRNPLKKSPGVPPSSTVVSLIKTWSDKNLTSPDNYTCTSPNGLSPYSPYTTVGYMGKSSLQVQSEVRKRRSSPSPTGKVSSMVERWKTRSNSSSPPPIALAGKTCP